MALAGTSHAESRRFQRPKQGNQLLDWCFDWGTGCGEKAATAWCKNKGFAKALTFSKWPDVGDTQPTRLIGSGAVCDQKMCDAFRFIVCATSGSQTFSDPKQGSYRLDWCYSWGNGCGAQAANAWCKSKGFAGGASSFTIAADIGDSQPTRLISTGAVCDQKMCDGFSSITCEQ
ncbi:hypothetical protein [Aestuariivirga sp.]|uniref:hypothetical protein n=1 Tax=Aestuariivirga sp. TaxID=2650926 RepID=UPI003918BE9A